MAQTVVPDVVERVPRRPAGNGADRYERGQQQSRLEDQRGDHESEAERRWDPKAEPEAPPIGVAEPVALHREVAAHPAAEVPVSVRLLDRSHLPPSRQIRERRPPYAGRSYAA